MKNQRESRIFHLYEVRFLDSLYYECKKHIKVELCNPLWLVVTLCTT
jgi:hypothetical protein